MNNRQELQEIWSDLRPKQKQWVAAMQQAGTMGEAAKEVGLKPGTIYQWPEKVRVRAVNLYADATAELAMQELEEALTEAAMVKTKEVRNPGSTERSQQAAASDIMDRVMGKPTQKQDIDMDARIEGIDVVVHPDADEPDVNDGK